MILFNICCIRRNIHCIRHRICRHIRITNALVIFVLLMLTHNAGIMLLLPLTTIDAAAATDNNWY